MRALTISDKELVLVERDAPSPRPMDVLVDVKTAGINAADLLQRRGFYPAPPGWPVDIPGMEFCGDVVALGEGVDPSLLHKRVAGIVGSGAQASQCTVPSEHLLVLPKDVDVVQAGGFAETFTTAYDALISQGELHAGDRVLISGAAGGVGVAAVQIAHQRGAHVTAVTRDETHHERLRSLGADETILLSDVAGIEPVDVVLELIGAAHFEIAQNRLRPFARVVVIGVGAGGKVEINLLNLMQTRARFTGSTLRSRSRSEKSDAARNISENVLPHFLHGEFHVPILETFELRDAAQAYELFDRPGKFGKIVLRIDQ